MPIGCFLILINPDANVERQAVFMEEDTPTIELGKNELLKIRMAHSDKSAALTVLQEIQIYSYKKEFKEKKAIYQLYGGLFFTKDENSAAYKDQIQSFTESMQDKRFSPNEELADLIKTAYIKYFQQQQTSLDRAELEKQLSERVKMLNLKGKFDDANELLAKIKKIPAKLFEAYEAAEKAIKSQDYDKAEKDFETAMKLSAELGEKDLEKQMQQKMKMSKRIPSLIKKRDENVEKALNGLRNDKFEDAQKYFKEAADISVDLMDSRKAEEYGLKAKALAEYVLVDKKYRR
jgi:hypothetical protein